MKKGEGGDRTSSNRTGQLLENRLGKERRRCRKEKAKKRERKEERNERKRKIHKSKFKNILK